MWPFRGKSITVDCASIWTSRSVDCGDCVTVLRGIAVESVCTLKGDFNLSSILQWVFPSLLWSVGLPTILNLSDQVQVLVTGPLHHWLPGWAFFFFFWNHFRLSLCTIHQLRSRRRGQSWVRCRRWNATYRLWTERSSYYLYVSWVGSQIHPWLVCHTNSGTIYTCRKL